MIKMILKEEVINCKSRVDKYALELNELSETYNKVNKQLITARYDAGNGIERAEVILEELTPQVNDLKDKVDITRSDLKKAVQIYEDTKREYNRFSEKVRYNRTTKAEAINDGKPYTDEEIKIIFLDCNKPWEDFLNEEIDYYRRKFKRTYLAIEAIVRVKQEYLETGEIRDFYYDEKNDKWTDNALQFKRILNKLISEKKI